MELDLVLHGGSVLTMDPARPAASALGIWQGRVAALDDDALALPARRTVDLGGATVLPGFVDAHSHLVWTGLGQRSVDLSGCRGVEELLDAVAGAAAVLPADAWVDAAGYDQRPLGRHLTAAELDRAADGRRVLAVHASGHAAAVSSAVLAQVDPAALAAAGPLVLRGPDGAPSGVLLEEAVELVTAVRKPYALDELVDALDAATRACAAQGVTSTAEAGIGWGIGSRSPVEVTAHQRALETGRLRTRVQLMVSGNALRPVAAHPADGVARGLDLGLRTGFGGERLSIGAVKLWLDGGMMARTAALTEPYAGSTDAGALSGDQAQVAALVREAHAAGWQLALHAIGDAAVDTALDLVEAAQRDVPRADARPRIEHCGLVRPDQLPRLAALGVTAVVQPEFVQAFGADYARVLGPRRADWLYRGRAFLDAGVRLAGSSDRPVSSGSPLRAVQTMVDRTTREGEVVGPGEALTVDEALAAWTTGAARACRTDHLVGSLTPGRLADVVVLADDPRAVPVGAIGAIEVLATALGGELVHGAWPTGA